MDLPPRGHDRKEVEDAFQVLLEKLRSDPAASRSFLGGQPEDLRVELERMLADYRLLLETFAGSASSMKRGRRLGEYELLAEIGRGGTGSVWEAEHRALHRRVALKLLHPHLSLSPRALERFRREALAGARLSHPGIVTVYETGEDEGIGYLAMELIPGGFTLGDRIAEWREARGLGREHWRELSKFFQDTAEALAYAHQLGVVHRDLKPGNILISEEGRPRLADFGLAKLRDELAMSRTGEMAGTPYYMSPEQAGGRAGDAGPQADVFALGVTLYESLTLQRPFEGESVTLVLTKILRDDPRDPRSIREDIPRDLAAIALKALQKRPAARYAGAKEMAEDLRRYLADEAVLAQPPGAIAKGTRWMRKHPVWSSTIAVVAIALVVLTWQFVAIAGEQRLTQAMLALTGRAVQIIDPRGIGLDSEENVQAFVSDIEALLPKLGNRPADKVRLLTLRAQVRSAARKEGALEDFNHAVEGLRVASEIPDSERANILFLAGMERIREYKLSDALEALEGTLKIAQQTWPSRDEVGHWNDPHVLDIAAQYVLALLRGSRMMDIAAFARAYGEPETWMGARWNQLQRERGIDSPMTIESGLALARWHFDQRTVQGGNLRAKEIYDKLRSATSVRFGAGDPRTLEAQLMYLAAWERSGASQATLNKEILPQLKALQEKIESTLGRDNPLSLLAMRRLAVCYIDLRATAKAAALCPTIVKRTTDVLGPGHVDTYNARTDWGIALAYEDPECAVDLLTQLISDMKSDGNIGPRHEVTLIAHRALGLAYEPLAGFHQQVEVYWEAFQARGGWENLQDSETVVDLMSCLNSAVAIHWDDFIDEVLNRLPRELSAALSAVAIDPRTSWDFFHAVYMCMDVAQRTGRDDSVRSLLALIGSCIPLDAPGPGHTIPMIILGRVADCQGNPIDAEQTYRRAIQEEGDCGAMELLGQLLARQGKESESQEMFQRAIDRSNDCIFCLKIRTGMNALSRK